MQVGASMAALSDISFSNTTTFAETPQPPVITCPKCGFSSMAGTFSCCVKGGTWSKKCGGAGDTNFEYTWSQGIQACASQSKLISIESMLTETMACAAFVCHSYCVTMLTCSPQPHRNPWQRQPLLYAPNASPTRKVKLLVALRAVLGTSNVAIPAT